jgi:hypothetical protein
VCNLLEPIKNEKEMLLSLAFAFCSFVMVHHDELKIKWVKLMQWVMKWAKLQTAATEVGAAFDSTKLSQHNEGAE